MTPQPEQKPMGEAARVVGVLTDPKPAFAAIAARPRPWVPLLLCIAMSMVFLTCFSRQIGWERSMRRIMENNKRMQQLDAEKREQVIQTQLKFAPVGAYVAAAVGTPIMALVMGGVLLGVFKMMGAQVRFKQAFSIASYAMLPGLISGALGIVVMFLKNPDDFNIQNPLAFNPGAFLDPQSTSPGLLSLATSIDLFSLWIVVLLAIGFQAASPKQLSFGKALTGVLIPWVLLILIKAGWASMFG